MYFCYNMLNFRPIYDIITSSVLRKEVIDMPTTGEKPGAGTYTCTNCGQGVVLNDDTDTMPPCPNCGNSEFN